MKKCPNCDRTFDDNMRFCQTDGTPLVDDVPLDPYKTVVARPEDIAAAIPKDEPSAELPKTAGSIPISAPSGDEVLDIPAQSDPLKTMYASEEEIRREMAARDDEKVIDLPPLGEAPPKPAQPDFSAPAPPPASPFDSKPPASSPFGSGSSSEPKTPPPIPTPFGEPKREFSDPVHTSPPPKIENPAFVEPEPVGNVPPANPFSPPPAAPMAQSSFNPPPSSATPMGAGGPPTPAGAQAGVNQTLPIVSMIFGIVSLCCYVSPVTGLVALITGYKGIKNANNDPKNYGGKGFAIAGMITGGLFFLVGLLYWLYIIFVVGLSGLFAIMGALNRG